MSSNPSRIGGRRSAALLSVILAAAMIAVAAVPSAAAAVTYSRRWGASGAEVCAQTDNRSMPRSCSDGSGGVIVTWQDLRADGVNYAVYVQRLNASGTAQWTAGGVLVASNQGQATFAQYPYPDIVPDGSHGAYVVWTNKGASPWTIYAHHVTSAGALDANWAGGAVGGVPVSSGWGVRVRYPAIALSMNGATADGLVCAYERNYSGAYNDIQAEKLDATNGNQLWGVGRPVKTPAVNEDQQGPSVISDGAGGAFVAFSSDDGTAAWRAYAQKFNDSGSAQWTAGTGASRVSTQNFDQFYPKIAAADTGYSMIVYSDENGTGNPQLFTQKIANDLGTPQWPSVGSATGIQVANTVAQDKTQLVSTSSAGFTTWVPEAGGGVYAGRINFNGSFQWTAGGVLLSSTTDSSTASPGICTDGTGGAIASWMDTRSGGSTVYAQRLNSSGTPVWGTGGVSATTNGSVQSMPVLVTDGSMGAIAAWQDMRNAKMDIYGQRISNAAPTFTSVTPDWGYADRDVACVVRGGNFLPGVHAKIWKDGDPTYIPADVNTYVSTTQLNCTFKLGTRAAPVGVYDFIVWNGDGQTVRVDNAFTVAVPPPDVKGFSPSSGPPGTRVTITGNNFGTMTAASGGAAHDDPYVAFNGVRATTYYSWSDTKIVTEVPEGATAGAVQVVTAAGAGEAASDFDVIFSRWYLAEGSTAWGFDTYISIINPNPTVVDVRLTYMPTGAANQTEDVTMAPNSRATVFPRAKLGSIDFSTKVECLDNKTIAVDRDMEWTGTGAACPEDHSSVGVTGPNRTWYLAEGSSAWGFECWLLIQNPGSTKANVDVTYMIEGEGARTVEHQVDAHSRATFSMETDIGQKDASIYVSSDQPVIPERAMYRNSRREGHDSIGTTSPGHTYYLAEGTTDYGFTTYVLIQNPGTTQNDVNVFFQTKDGMVPYSGNPVRMPAQSRKTIRVNDVLGATDFSTSVVGGSPVIAERAMYWNSATGEACHDSIGLAAPHTMFYLPDGQAGSDVETFTLVQNPNDSAVKVEVAYLSLDGGTPKTMTDTIPANSRRTYDMSAAGVSGPNGIVVTCKTAGKKIMVERAMYWYNRGAGTDTIGGYDD